MVEDYAAVAQILLSGSSTYSKRITYITKLDKEGTFQWCKLVRHQMPQFTASGEYTPVHGPSIDCDSQGNIYILYTRRGHSISYDTSYLEKRNSSGVRQWGKQIRIKSNNTNSVAVDVTPSSMLSSAAVDVTPSMIFNSAVVAVTPSKISVSYTHLTLPTKRIV